MIRYKSIQQPYAMILMLIALIGLSFNSDSTGMSVDNETLCLSIIFIVYVIWQTFFNHNYRVNEFILKDKQLEIQTHKGLKIQNINVNINDIQKFQTTVNVDCKRLFRGAFETDIQIDLNNGQHYEMKNYSRRMELFEALAKAIKKIPNSNIFVYSNVEKGLYSQESMSYYIENEKYPEAVNSTNYIGVIIILLIMIIAFMSMFFQ